MATQPSTPTEPEASTIQVIARHVQVCAKCRAIYESDPQLTAEVLFHKAHDRRGVLTG